MPHTGTVKWYNNRLGYGFIQREDGEDVFIHYSALQEVDSLDVGDAVEFEIADGPKGPMAIDVSVLI